MSLTVSIKKKEEGRRKKEEEKDELIVIQRFIKNYVRIVEIFK